MHRLQLFLYTYNLIKEFIVCPKCGKKGFKTERWVRSSYYPRVVSLKVMSYESALERYEKDPTNPVFQLSLNSFRNKVRGNRYRGRRDKYLIGIHEENSDKDQCYRVQSRKYCCTYIGHYDKELYKKQKQEYLEKKRKTKPNGRRWCKYPEPRIPSLRQQYYRELKGKY